MKKRENYKVRWLSLLLAAVMAFGVVPVQAEAASTNTAELEVAVSGSTATFTLYAEKFDAAGFCVSGVTSLTPADGFNTVVNKAADSKYELLVQSTEPVNAERGTVIATAAVNGDVAFAPGSAAYLENKAAVAYNGYQTLTVTTTKEASLWAVKAAAVKELTAHIEECRSGEITAAQRELLARCLQAGKAAIHNSGMEDAVGTALNEYKNRANEIVESQKTADFPKLTALSDSAGGGALTSVYPAFSPETYAYFLSNGLNIGNVRTLYAAVPDGVTVKFNGRDIAVSDGAFSFDVPYEAEKNTFALTLTDTETGLTSSYVFCSLGTVSGGFNAATLKLYDEEGNADPEKVSKFEKENERVFHGSSLTDTVRIGFQVLQQGGANSEFYAELVDEAGKVIEKFSLADDKDIQQDIVSKAITLKPGMNWFLLRHYGVDKSKYVDGKPAETPAYRTVAIVVNYNDPTESDATPEGISVWLEGSKGVNRLEGFDGETTEYNVTLPVDGFLLGEGQPVHLALELKEGQTATVYGGNDVAQNRYLNADGTYHVADYYADQLMKKDAFDVTVTVAAKNGVAKTEYVLHVTKAGGRGMLVPAVYGYKEALITKTNSVERGVQLTYASVVITDEDGTQIDTAAAAQKGWFTIEIEKLDVLSGTGKSDGGNFTVTLHKVGSTKVTLCFDDGKGEPLRKEVIVDVNYDVSMIGAGIEQAQDLLADESRQYPDEARSELAGAIQQAQAVYNTYYSRRREMLTGEQISNINSAVDAIQAAIETFKAEEIAAIVTDIEPLGITELPVPNETTRQEVIAQLPETVIAAVGGEKKTLTVTWEDTPFYVDKDENPRNYTFKARLPAGYKAAEGVMLPEVKVIRGTEIHVDRVERVQFPEGAETTAEGEAILRVQKGELTGQSGIGNMWFDPSGRRGRVDLPTEWEYVSGTSYSGKTMEDFNGDVCGTYIFRVKNIDLDELNRQAEEQWNDVQKWRYEWASDAERTMERVLTVVIDPNSEKPDDMGDDGSGGSGNGGNSGNGGSSGGINGALNGQPVTGGQYRDLLTDPLPSQGDTGTVPPNAGTSQTGRKTQPSTAKPNTTPAGDAPAGESSGDGAGTRRVISVSKDEQKGTTDNMANELAVLLPSCAALLVIGIIRGIKRKEE